MTNRYADLVAISIIFQQHSSAEYRSAHHKLNAQFSDMITEIDKLFNKDKSQVKTDADFASIITSKVLDSFKLNPANAAKVKELFHQGAMTIKWHLYNNVLARISKLKLACEDAVRGTQPYL